MVPRFLWGEKVKILPFKIKLLALLLKQTFFPVCQTFTGFSATQIPFNSIPYIFFSTG
jgi:hypothetical protein